MSWGSRRWTFDELAVEDWVAQQLPGSHWQRRFAVPRPVLEAAGVIQTCCLKTHRYGGHFTFSLKNSVGLVAKLVPGESYNYMDELHSSSDQRQMIAEINTVYEPDLVVLDEVAAFVERGPDQGKQVPANLILAGTDRVAIDVVGVAVLRHYGATPEVSRDLIFELKQIARAVELGLGVGSPDQIELITADADSAAYARQIRETLLLG